MLQISFAPWISIDSPLTWESGRPIIGPLFPGFANLHRSLGFYEISAAWKHGCRFLVFYRELFSQGWSSLVVGLYFLRGMLTGF